MATKVKSVYKALDAIKTDVALLCEDETVSPLLVWLLVRQQADYELALLAQPIE